MSYGVFNFRDMDQKAQNHFEKASRQLRTANEELFKPEEDVVSFLVCKNALSAIENFLKGYLSKRGYETRDKESLDQLLERCQMLDKKFQKLNLNVIDCSSQYDHNRYCEDVNKVSSCFNVADQLDTFLRKQGDIQD